MWATLYVYQEVETILLRIDMNCLLSPLHNIQIKDLLQYYFFITFKYSSYCTNIITDHCVEIKMIINQYFYSTYWYTETMSCIIRKLSHFMLHRESHSLERYSIEQIGNRSFNMFIVLIIL